MTKLELLGEVLKGVLLIVGEYRGGHADPVSWIDRKSGNKIECIQAIHIVECFSYGHLDRVIVSERFSPGVTLEQAQATLIYTRGQLYVFYIEWFKRERGQTYARLSPWGIEPIQEIEDAAAVPAGTAPPSNLVY